MKCEFLTECGMCTMKSKAFKTPIYCSYNPKFTWTAEEIKNAIVKIDETNPTQLQKGIEEESENKE